MAADGNARAMVIGVAVIAVAASGGALWWALGARGDRAAQAPMVATVAPSSSPSPAPAPAAGGGQGAKGAPTMVEAADRLSKRLAQKDGSADDWALLARTYVELEQYPDAVKAFAKAIEKSPGDERLRQEAAAAMAKAK